MVGNIAGRDKHGWQQNLHLAHHHLLRLQHHHLGLRWSKVPSMAAAARKQPKQQKGLSDFVQFADDTILWTASLILLNHLQLPANRAALAGKRVLELGSGLGHLGLGLSKLGAHVTCTERPKELPHLEASLAQQQRSNTSVLESALALYGTPTATNKEQAHFETQGATTTACSTSRDAQPDSNSHLSTHGQAQSVPPQAGEAQQGSIQAVALEWGEEGFKRSPLATQNLGTFDVIICSELYYIQSLFPELFWTLRRFAGPETVIWSIFIDRPFSFMFFSLLHDEGCWDVEQISGFDDLGLDPELQVHMHRIRLKSGNT